MPKSPKGDQLQHNIYTQDPLCGIRLRLEFWLVNIILLGSSSLPLFSCSVSVTPLLVFLVTYSAWIVCIHFPLTVCFWGTQPRKVSDRSLHMYRNWYSTMSQLIVSPLIVIWAPIESASSVLCIVQSSADSISPQGTLRVVMNRTGTQIITTQSIKRIPESWWPGYSTSFHIPISLSVSTDVSQLGKKTKNM